VLDEGVVAVVVEPGQSEELMEDIGLIDDTVKIKKFQLNQKHKKFIVPEIHTKNLFKFDGIIL